VYIDAVASCRGQAELIWKDRAGNILMEKSYQLNAGRNTLTADFSAASAAFPTELFLHCSLHGEWGEMQLTAENISCIFPAAQIPLPDNWTFLPRIGDNTAAGRVLGGKWQWTGKCMDNTGVIGSDGFFAGEDGGSWGIECGIDLREYASWSICGAFRIKEAPGASRKVLFRAGDPGGNGNCCIAGCLAEYDGKGGGRVVFRLNCSGTVQEAVVPLVPEKLFKPFIVIIVRDSIRNRMGVTVHGHGCEWLPLPENSVVPFSVPGTAHPLLEAGCCVPDRLSYSSEGCGIRSLFATDLPLTEGGAVFIARLMS
jgi:hypothetical protein